MVDKISQLEEGKIYIAFYESSGSFVHKIYDAVFYEIDFDQTLSMSTMKPDVYLKKISKYFFPLMMKKDALDLRLENSFPPSIEPFFFRLFTGSQLFEFHSGHYAQYSSLVSERHGCWNTIESRSITTSQTGRKRNETDFSLEDLILFKPSKREIKALYIPQSLASLYEIASKESKSFEFSTLFYYLYATFILFQESSVNTILKTVDILCISSSQQKCQIRVFDRTNNEMARYGFGFSEKKAVFLAEKEIETSPMNVLQCYHKTHFPFRLHVRSFLLTHETYIRFYFDDQEVSSLYDKKRGQGQDNALLQSILKILSAEPLRFEVLSTLSSIFILSKTCKTLEISDMYMSRNEDFLRNLLSYMNENEICARERVKILYFFGMYLLYHCFVQSE
jgi:hypothetical protein